ncbi:hypothetical protein [Sphingomonas rubra]|uniref:Uncharacterized protein n=1 Tax=Sphingomonas rubra TaxID=634430 RepID=A0A1I5TU22_9SPHN|nr:hypothetical protein [Sphingomonas rubra]SFP86575.1 hypothetical protein SAMN04488241_10956 [Sphingomonas rubra]
MIALALAAIVAAMLLVRLGWAGRRGAAPIGWAIAAVALVVLVVKDGAWGLAVGTTVAIVAALALVLHAAAISAPRTMRPPREAPAVHVPHHARDVARRVAVFALVVPVAFVAAQGLAFGLQALARRAGWDDANTTVLALFLQPVLWTAIMAVQMTRASTARMVAPPAVAAVAGLLLWSAA